MNPTIINLLTAEEDDPSGRRLEFKEVRTGDFTPEVQKRGQ